MKLCGLVGWLVGCLAVGVYQYRQSLARVEFYRSVVSFCHHLRTEIGFAQQPLSQIIARDQHTYAPRWQRVLQAYGQLLQSKADITREKCQQLVADHDLAEFLCHLGRTDSHSEQQKITTAIQLFTTKQTQAQTYLQQKASIILKLLIIMGIAGVVLWI